MKGLQKLLIASFALLVFISGAKLVLFSHYCCGIWIEVSINPNDACSTASENSCCETSSHPPLSINKSCCETEAVVFDLGSFASSNFKFEGLSLTKIFPKNFLHYLYVLFIDFSERRHRFDRSSIVGASPPLHLQQPRYISFHQLVLYA